MDVDSEVISVDSSPRSPARELELDYEPDYPAAPWARRDRVPTSDRCTSYNTWPNGAVTKVRMDAPLYASQKAVGGSRAKCRESNTTAPFEVEAWLQLGDDDGPWWRPLPTEGFLTREAAEQYVRDSQAINPKTYFRICEELD